MLETLRCLTSRRSDALTKASADVSALSARRAPDVSRLNIGSPRFFARFMRAPLSLTPATV